MSAEHKAVFLSYASQDAEAARRICESLRAAGVEVWFDQNELVGGDAWDAKIRGQIASCALFVPIISANTQARREGYFRREWKQAAERTRDIADGTPFLLPVVIDATRDADALVPAEFKAMQWTRLRPAMRDYGGQARDDAGVAAFCARVQKLLGAEMEPGRPRPGERGAGIAEVSAGKAGAAFATSASPKRSRRVPAAAWIGAVMVVAAIAIFLTLKSKPNPVAEARPPASAPAATKSAAGPRLGPKSIAVLPFENLSEEGNASAFFADGMHEDVITNLLLIRDLRCVPRATVIAYRASRKTLREISDELGVAFVLTGTVRRANTTVRITGTLINPRTDETLWTKPYDKELTNVFAIQASLAQEIAAALRATLSPGEKSSLERRPTENVAAYELVLKARELRHAFSAGGPSARSVYHEMEPLLQSAVKLDPNYAGAHAELASALIFLGGDDNLKKARIAIDRAGRLAPDAPEVRLASGDYFDATSDTERALAEFEALAKLRPNDPGPYERMGVIYRRQMRPQEALASFRKVKDIDPGNLRNSQSLVLLLLSGRRYQEAMAEQRAILSRIPDNREANFYLGYLAFLATGSMVEYEQALRRFAEQIDQRWALRVGRLDEALQLDRGSSSGGKQAANDAEAILIATVHAARGQQGAARARLGDLSERLRRQTQINWVQLGFVEALMGRKEEARRCAREAEVQSAQPRQPTFVAALARLYAWAGEKDAAIAAYAELLPKAPGLTTPSNTYNVHVMKTHPDYFPLRGDARFEALLKDPKNNAPLF
jgi:TolB-like protein/tetratricopeptide (TPR) repeat protein